MRIGIDCRMAETGEGISRYIEELVRNLAVLDKDNEYILLIQNNAANSKFQILSLREIFTTNNKFEKEFVNSPYYSLAEQTKFILELRRLKLDLVHFPSFNAPIFYPGKFIVTIHDIIHHLFPGKKKSRWFHRVAYRAVINSAIKRASRVIAVSEATKKDIINTFNISQKKVQVIYEGVNEKFFEKLSSDKIQEIKSKFSITKPYLLYVGVWRQYKNLERLAKAFDILKEKYHQDYQLVLAGQIDSFYPEIKQAVMAIKNAGDIIATGYIGEPELHALYQGAKAFVLPSLVEGFGLICLEAQAVGIPVVASDIAVLREILGESAVYFDPLDPACMASGINSVLTNDDLRLTLQTEGRKNAEKFTWKKTAFETLEVFKQALNL